MLNAPLITAIGTVSGAFIGAAAVFLTSRRHLAASLRSTASQQWNDKFRDAVAEFQSVLHVLEVLHERGNVPSEVWLPKFQSAAFLYSKIRLLLDSQQDLHLKMEELTKEALEALTVVAK